MIVTDKTWHEVELAIDADGALSSVALDGFRLRGITGIDFAATIGEPQEITIRLLCRMKGMRRENDATLENYYDS